MAATLEQFEPSAAGAGKIGTTSLPWGEGHFQSLRVNGAAVAPLASPALTGTPTAPTATTGTNTTQIATTAFVKAAADLAKARANHTGTQPASTISDFDAAVTASTAGSKAHVANTDTKLANGTANEVTAAALRAHLDATAIHATLNDSGSGSAILWSSEKIAAEIAALTVGEVDTSLISNGAVTTAKLADGSVTTAKVADANITTAKLAAEAVTGEKVAGGTLAPGNSKYWGTSSLGVFGFHALPTVTLGDLGTLDAVNTGQITDAAVTAAKLATSAATTDKIASAAVTAAKIASDAVTTAKILDGAVTGAKVAGGTASPGSSKYWGTGSGGTFGFHAVPTYSVSGNLSGVLVGNGYQIRESKGADVASATTLTLGTDGNYYVVTGTTTITSFATIGVGLKVVVCFTGILTLTHHATDLILPGGANITTAAGDCAIFVEYAAGDWRCVAYQRASGYPLLGSFNAAIPGAIGGTTPAAGTFTNLTANTSLLPPVYTLATLPAASGNAGKVITVSDGDSFAGGSHWNYELAVSNGTDWKWASNGDSL
jgi:hypothetical protein